ncbi:MAG: DeoR/GlpR family DNA-binding transcription regulator [Oscillospiraceae bacterium]|nr:DeoR/GlpR family DNA-binding transcription regulator [Oscillospiraceae bacterium]
MDRTERIIEIIQQYGGISFKDLSRHFDVTEMTIRRDIEKMKERGIVKTVSGAIMLSDSDIYKTYSLDKESATNYEQKEAIGAVASSLIGTNEVIFVDIGSTTVNILHHLRPEDNNTVIVATENALRELLHSNYKNYIVTGGKLDPQSGVFVDRYGINTLKRYTINIAFISAAGIDGRLGVTCINEFEVPIKQNAMQISAIKCLVADSSKFGVVRMHNFGSLEDFDIVITDKGLSKEWAEILEQKGIRLIIA